MLSATLKKDHRDVVSHFPGTLPVMAWHFASNPAEDSLTLPGETWTCLFRHIEDVAHGRSLRRNRGQVCS